MQADKDQTPKRLYIRDIRSLDEEIHTIADLMHPETGLDFYELLFRRVVRLFIGDMDGFQASNTAYHDLTHTLATTLAAARVMHGLHLSRTPISARGMELALCCALLHDSGYIMKLGDEGGTGAKYTFTHVTRSIELMRDWFTAYDRPAEDIRDAEAIIRGTDLGVAFKDIPFASDEVRLLACCVASADLLAQMSDELYAEKLHDLHREFREAGMPGYETEFDLVSATTDFAALMDRRMREDLDNVAPCARAHFEQRWKTDVDVYAESIEKNISFLESIVERHGPDYHTQLRRSRDRRPPFI